MKKIININFHSRVVPIEETAYEILQQYIESLRRHFANEEGRDEIISDIENRFAELFSETLKKGAACITDADVNAIITSMGRPEDFEDEEMGGAAASGGAYTGATTGTSAGTQGAYTQQESAQPEPRRLWRAENDKILGGVAAGIGNYLNIDPAIVRIVFVLTTFTGGAGFLIYIVLWAILPTKSLPANARKRLYRNPDDKVIAGVASGLAAYFHIEVWIPRLIFALPLILSIVAGFFRTMWFNFDSPIFFTGGFFGTLFITYIVLWIVLPEAYAASEKLEMRGEKVDLESIKNTIKSDLESFSKKAKDMGANVGSEMKNTFQKRSEQARQNTQNFTAEPYPTKRNGFGHAVGVLFKAFFLCIAGIIAFGLVMVLILVLFRGHGIFNIKNYIISDTWENFLLWISFFLFLVIPVIALLTWLIRRITGVRSRHHYLRWTFSLLWTIGLFCTIGLAGMIVNNFQARQHVEENITLSRPSHNKLIVKTMEGRHYSYYDFDGDWSFDFNWDHESPFYDFAEDSLVLNNVRINLVKSEDSSFHVDLIKISHGDNGATARHLAEQIGFPIQQTDSILSLPHGFVITKNQKFRNQQVMVTIAVPVGRHILVDRSVEQYSWRNINVHKPHRRWNKHRDIDNDWGRDYDEYLDINKTYDWNSDTEYMMTTDGLVRTDKRKVDHEEEKNKDDGDDNNNDDKKKSDENPGYRYKNPAKVDTVKKTAALQPVTDSHLYLLSALFQ